MATAPGAIFCWYPVFYIEMNVSGNQSDLEPFIMRKYELKHFKTVLIGLIDDVYVYLKQT